MNKELKIHFNDGMKRVDVYQAIEELKKHESFTVFCQFIDPRTDSLVEGKFTFYPSAQPSYKTHCPNFVFIAHHDGLCLYIPADMAWWADKQASGSMVEIKYITSVLIKGCYQNINFKFDVSPAIRVNKYLNKRHESLYPTRLKQLKDKIISHSKWMRNRAFAVASTTESLLRHQELKLLKIRVENKIDALSSLK